MTCKRHKWIWIPVTTMEHALDGELLAFDLGVCNVCQKKKSRLRIYSPGDQVAAMLWGEGKFEAKRVKK